MARYIDAEAFKRKLIDEKGFFPAIIARALEEMPNADVVPKSEVAREVFEAIEEEIKQSLAEHNNKKLQYNIDDALFHLYHGITASQMGMLDFIAELKKKYTEGEN